MIVSKILQTFFSWEYFQLQASRVSGVLHGTLGNSALDLSGSNREAQLLDK